VKLGRVLKYESLERISSSTIARSFRVFDFNDRRKILLITFSQVSLSVLDLLGVVIFGILGALTVTGVQSQDPSSRVAHALDILNLGDFSFQSQVAALAILATLFLLTRTILSIFYSRKSLHFLSSRSAYISSKLTEQLLNQSLLIIQSRSSQQTLFSLTAGVVGVTVGIIGSSIALVSDFSLLLILTIALLLVDPIIAVSTFVIFAVIGVGLYFLMHRRARRLSAREVKLTMLSNQKILESLLTFRETVVGHRQSYYASEISKLRHEIASTQAEQAFLPNIAKYVIEISVVVGALLIAAMQFVLFDASHAAATLAVFIAAGSRIAPAVLRVQQGLIQIKSNSEPAKMSLSLIDEIGLLASEEKTKAKPQDWNHVEMHPDISIKNISLTYPNRIDPAISKLSLEVSSGSVIALVGPSGAGKSTLADLILGVLEPDSGTVHISRLSPKETVAKWPGSVSYMPQDISLIEGTIRENVSLGYPLELATDARVLSCLEKAQLLELISELPDGLDSIIGERGTSLSGGQRQRLGIARALFTNPRLLVLDEATSALDGQTESLISKSINLLKGRVTLILIAHRLSTIRDADQIYYLNNGKIQAAGNFEELRAEIPDFKSQAYLSGL
jgi:ABC-type multidrug transport system fused ATPase/permease subunit